MFLGPRRLAFVRALGRGLRRIFLLHDDRVSYLRPGLCIFVFDELFDLPFKHYEEKFYIFHIDAVTIDLLERLQIDSPTDVVSGGDFRTAVKRINGVLEADFPLTGSGSILLGVQHCLRSYFHEWTGRLVLRRDAYFRWTTVASTHAISLGELLGNFVLFG